MGPSFPAFFRDPQIRYLPELVGDLHRGHLALPVFQRRLGWDLEMRRLLLDSIRRGFPTGAMLEWRANTVKVGVKDRLGPFKLPSVEHGSVRQFLLDGEQRLATVWFATYDLPEVAPVDPDAEPADAYRMFFDLREERFLAKQELSDVPPHMLPMTVLFEGVRLTKFQRELERKLREAGEDTHSIEELIRRSDELANIFRSYKIPIVAIASDDAEVVTTTFQRINRQHLVMGEEDMVQALAWAKGVDLFREIDRVRADLDQGWSDLDALTILRVAKCLVGEDPYEADPELVAGKLAARPDTFGGVREHIARAVSFFRETSGILTPRLVPYPLQIVAIAASLSHDLKEPIRKRLADWLWFTTYTEAFARQMSSSRFAQFQDEVAAIVAGKSLAEPVDRRAARRQPLPRRFDFRHARSRALALVLAQHGPRDASGQVLHALRLLADAETRAVPQLVTAAMDGQVSPSPASRVLMAPEAVAELRELMSGTTLAAPGNRDSVAASHFITVDALEAYAVGDYARFDAARRAELERVEGERFVACWSGLYDVKPAS